LEPEPPTKCSNVNVTLAYIWIQTKVTAIQQIWMLKHIAEILIRRSEDAGALARLLLWHAALFNRREHGQGWPAHVSLGAAAPGDVTDAGKSWSYVPP
jgi:hypothetical protein